MKGLSTMTGLRRAIMVAGCCLGFASGCTRDLWDGVNRQELIFSQVDGIDRPRPGESRPAVLVVRYKTSVDPSPTDPGYSVGVPVDSSEHPAGPFATEGPPPMLGFPVQPMTTATAATDPTGGAVHARPLVPADFRAGEIARRSPTFIPAGTAGGVDRGGSEGDDPTTTWIDYFTIDDHGNRSTTRWVRLPRHVSRPGGPSALQVAGAVALTPVTLAADALSVPLGILYPLLGGS